MKIIFLDMDGVLCTVRAHIAQYRAKTEWHMTALDREAVGLLNAIHDHDKGNVEYVLSSTWRKQYDQEYMVNHLRKFGWTGRFHQDWKTPALYLPRHVEIKDWLEHNKHDQFIILDDSADAGIPEDLESFIQTDPDAGISLNNYTKAMEVLYGIKRDIYLV